MKYRLTALAAAMLMAQTVSAATRIDLHHQQENYIKPYLAEKHTGSTQLTLIEAHEDFNHVKHSRYQQTFSGYRVWDATSMVHTPPAIQNGRTVKPVTMNGVIYEGIDSDLAATPAYALNDLQEKKAMEQAKLRYQKKTGVTNVVGQHETSEKIIYIDNNGRAHYAYLNSFYMDDHKTGAHRPTTITDAVTLKVYRSWDQVMTLNPNKRDEQLITAGGVGGNEKIHELYYDGDTGHLPALTMKSFKEDIEILPGQNVTVTYCVFENDDVIVRDVSYASTAFNVCIQQEGKHNNVAWISTDSNDTRWRSDQVHGGFSPSLDAFYGATVIKKLYKEWYGLEVLTKDDHKTPMQLVMRTHYGRGFDNAFWDGEQMTFGDGESMFYPLTSLDVAAHEIAHGFTMQHSNIDGSWSQMAALHESFSDMAAVAAGYYSTGKANWDIGRDIMINEGALRYMADPRKDGTSIDNMKDYNEFIEAHSLAGVTNKAFYLLATTRGWNVRKAFDVMVKANRDYWTSSMQTFNEAACGVVSAAEDYNAKNHDNSYSVADIRIAFGKTGIDTDNCSQ